MDEKKKKHPIGDLMSTTIEKLQEMVSSNTVIGEPIRTDDVTLIPISKISIGFGTGGSDFSSKNQRPERPNSFGGGGGGGVNVTPVGFLVVKGESVKFLPVALPANNSIDRVVEMVPDLVDKVADFIEKKKEEKEAEEASDFV